jgi:hypothetical protein
MSDDKQEERNHFTACGDSWETRVESHEMKGKKQEGTKNSGGTNPPNFGTAIKWPKQEDGNTAKETHLVQPSIQTSEK